MERRIVMRNHVLANEDAVEDAMQVAPMLSMTQEMLSTGPAGQVVTLSSEATTGLCFILMLAEMSIQALVDLLVADEGKKERKERFGASQLMTLRCLDRGWGVWAGSATGRERLSSRFRPSCHPAVSCSKRTVWRQGTDASWPGMEAD